MIRTVVALLFPALLLLSSPGHAEAQWDRPYSTPNYGQIARDALPGLYTNVSNSGTCEVRPHRRGYLFINENGSQALFAYYAPGKMRMIAGTWNPEILVSVSQDRQGRTVLRFEEPFTPAGYWVSQ